MTNINETSMRIPVPRIHSITLLPSILFLQLVLLGLVLQYRISYLPFYTRIAGIAFVGSAALFLFYYKLTIPKGSLLLFAYLFWCSVSGIYVALNYDVFISTILTNIQIYMLAFSVVVIVLVKRDVSIALIPFIITLLLIALYGFVSGDFEIGKGALQGERQTSLLHNANGLGNYSLLGIIGVLYYWRSNNSIVLRALQTTSIIMFIIAILYSGSRKSYLVLLVFVAFWIWYCYRDLIVRNIVAFTIFLIAIVCSYLLGVFVIENTTLGSRLMQSMENPDIDTNRLTMLLEALDVFIAHPFTGIGLGNFSVISRFHTYSHSDYAEVLSTTGLIGFILYFTIYIHIWKKLGKIRHYTNDDNTMYRLGLFKAAIIALLFLSLGTIVSQEVMMQVFIAIIIGFVQYHLNSLNAFKSLK